MLPYRPMMQPYASSALEEELAYRRELRMSPRGVRTRPGSWFRGRRRSR